MLKTFKFILMIFSALLWWGCASSRWFSADPSADYRKIGWDKYYSGYCQGHMINISLGKDKNGRIKLAIDCQKVGSAESFRLHVVFYENQTWDINLFQYLNHEVQGAAFNKRCQQWQTCFIKQLPGQKMFVKLPLNIQNMVLLAVSSANKEFTNHYYQNR